MDDAPRRPVKNRGRRRSDAPPVLARDAINLAFEEMGGWKALSEWAQSSPRNQEIFYSRIYPRILLLQIHADVRVQTIAEIRFAGLND